MRAVAGRRSGRAGLAVPLATKFHAPGIRKDWVERPDLVQRLADAAARTRIILVDAPAGFGKTTLVAQWRASAMQSQRFAWVSLDQGDNDPARLWWYITHALRRACPELSGEAFVPGRQVQVPDAVTVLPALVNELATLSAPVVLVLDDYHAITEASCHEQMTFFLQHLPSSARVVLITRTDPPLPLARLRTAGEMVEFRAPELRFSLAEAAQLVQAISAVQLSEPDLAVLVGQTEGWPAACTSRHSLFAAIARRALLSASSAATTSSSPTFSSRKCSAASPPRSGNSSCGPPFSAASARHSAMPLPGRPMQRRLSTSSTGRISSSCRSMRPGSGSVITAFSRTCYAGNLTGPGLAWFLHCTSARVAGIGGQER